MKKILQGSGFLVLSLLLSACGQNNEPKPKDNTVKCERIEKNLLKVALFTQKVESMSAFHLEEYARAIDVPNISTSNNKPKMLKDAAKRKASLEAEQEELGCPISNT